MRLDSPAVLATAGTLAIHVLLAVLGDALVIVFPEPKPDPAPRVELIDLEPIEPEPPPPEPEPEPEPETEPEPTTPERPAPTEPQPRPQARVQQAPPPSAEPPPPTDTPPSNDSGGAPVTTMENIAPSATGVPVAKGTRNTGRVGRGGTGGGTGAGTGAGSADVPPPKPVSVATIKTRAMPKGDFSYFDASKDYPPEAKALGIEGVIRVRLIVDATGRVKTAVLLNRLGHGLDELALERAKKIEFEPARDTDDKPVTSVVVWTFNMTLPQ